MSSIINMALTSPDPNASPCSECGSGEGRHYPVCNEWATWKNFIRSMYSATIRHLSNRKSGNRFKMFIYQHIRHNALGDNTYSQWEKQLKDNDPVLYNLIMAAERAQREVDNHIFDRYKNSPLSKSEVIMTDGAGNVMGEPMLEYAERGRAVDLLDVEE